MQSPAPDSGQVPPCPLMSIEGMFANVTGVTFRGLTRAPRLDRPDDPRFDRLMVLMRTVIQVLREHGVRMPHTWVSVRRRTATTLDVAIGAGSHILWSNVWPWAG
ncbi:MAG: hypothetical protein OWU33_16730, partial [Firmicutes bacterium]|nr:hypothetical protein [Bacillota bacterium]